MQVTSAALSRSLPVDGHSSLGRTDDPEKLQLRTALPAADAGALRLHDRRHAQASASSAADSCACFAAGTTSATGSGAGSTAGASPSPVAGSSASTAPSPASGTTATSPFPVACAS